jgi:hypothetical protein
MSNVKKLPDSYAKGTQSNNYKLLNINEQAIADVKTDAEAVFNMVDLQQATGATLDLYGDMVGQKRGALNDTQYRFMILTRVGINVGQGNYPTVINLIKQIFNCEASDVVLEDDPDAVAKVKIKTFPIQVLVNAGFTSLQAVEMIEMLLPIGVGVSTTNFNGTFEFADSATEYDENAGFGDIEQTIGGYLGLLTGEDTESPILPI